MKPNLGRGDGGWTEIGGGRARKDDPRLTLCGDLDELVACLGQARPLLRASPAERLEPEAAWAQDLCFRVAAVFAGLRPAEDLRGAPAAIERRMAALAGDLPPIDRFVLPGGSAPGAALHVARAVCRRAERAAAAICLGGGGPGGALAALNRLSDLLFLLARAADRASGREDLQSRGSG